MNSETWLTRPPPRITNPARGALPPPPSLFVSLGPARACWVALPWGGLIPWSGESSPGVSPVSVSFVFRFAFVFWTPPGHIRSPLRDGFDNILQYTILYYTILYYTILYYTILYYTILKKLLYAHLGGWAEVRVRESSLQGKLLSLLLLLSLLVVRHDHLAVLSKFPMELCRI